MSWFALCWKKYADFTGRAGRSEYWFFVLFNVIIAIVLAMFGIMVGTALGYTDDTGNRQMSGIGLVPYYLYLLAALVPSLAVGARRLHDTDRSAWWLLLGLVPLGGIVLLVFFVLDSTPGPNRYGPNPRDARAIAGVTPAAQG